MPQNKLSLSSFERSIVGAIMWGHTVPSRLHDCQYVVRGSKVRAHSRRMSVQHGIKAAPHNEYPRVPTMPLTSAVRLIAIHLRNARA